MFKLLDQSIDYVEQHLHLPIEVDDIAKAAMSSKYHFQRMFHAVTGVTITQYVRNRRLTLAAQELVGTNCKVIDTALKYGYDSPASFTKAFQRMHGVTPVEARKMNVKLKAFPRISFQIQVRGETEMNYRMVEEKGSIVFGKSIILHEDAFKEIPVFVEGIWKDGTHDQILELLERPDGTLLYGYHYDFAEDGSKRYLMGAEAPEGIQVPDGFTVLHIPDQTYAVFDTRGTMTDDVEIDLSIMNVWKRIYTEWFPSTSFEQVEGPCIEKYHWVDDQHQDFITEVWIPVRKKSRGMQ